MSRIRIYELAKELGLENKALLDLCIQLGMTDKKSHSNSLTDEEAEKIRRFVIRRAVSERAGSEREVTREGQLLTERRVGSVIRRRKKTQEEVEEERRQAEETADIFGDLKTAGKELPTLQPDLAAEKFARDEALRRADALFSAAEPESEEEEQEEAAVPGQVQPAAVQARMETVVRRRPEVEEGQGVSAAESVTLEEPSPETAAGVLPAGEEEAGEEVSMAELAPEEGGEAAPEEGREEGAGGLFTAEHLAAVRKRHDIRAPKVLGKIELPAKPEPAKRTGAAAERLAGGGEGEPDIGPASKPGRGKKRKPATVAASEEEEETPRGRRPKKKQILRKDELLDYDGEREVWRTKKDKKGRRDKLDDQPLLAEEAAPAKQTKKVIKIDGEISVGELAKQMSVKAGELIAQLMKGGVMATINQLIDFETATIVAEEFGHLTQNVEHNVEDLVSSVSEQDDAASMVLRPPVVTVMGHVDHGKTSLLDAIRKTSVTASEVGGITQHIGAYNVKLPSGGSVTFLDTPGHEAFTAMRGRGAQVTDIVVLVVAADDGVMPQTIEAINHARAAGVPIIVAINKIDKDNANPDRILTQLSEHQLVPEEWGGETLVVRVSARTREGLEGLLETLNLQAEILELKADPNRHAIGTIIESKLDRGRGPVSTVLVQRGTLRRGDAFVAGSVFGKVRALVADDGSLVDEAGPSIPVGVVGASATAMAGDDFVVLGNEVQARKIAEERAMRHRRKELAAASAGAVASGPLTLERFSALISESQEIKDLPLIVKGDVQGSVEAVTESLSQLSNEEVKVKIIHRGVGAVTENDVQLAAASNAIVVAFNVRPDSRANDLLESEGVELLYSRVIYDLVDLVGNALKGRMAPKFQEKALGRVEVRQTFKVPKQGTIAGSYVLDGMVHRGALVRLLRDGVVMYEGKMASLRRFKEDVREVAAGYECGIGLEGYSDIKDGDVIEVYKVEEVPH